MQYTDIYVLCFIYISLLCSHSFAFRSGEIIFNRKFTHFSSKLKDLAPITFQACQKACKTRVSCQSTNYHRLLHLCQLHSLRSGNSQDLNQAKGWIHMDYIKEDIGHCENNTCLPGEICIENGTSYTCKHEECRPVKQEENKGKGNMNDVGSRQFIDCTDGYLDNVSALFICNDTGKWITTGECGRGHCSHPEIDENVVWKEAQLIASNGVLYLNDSNSIYSDLANVSYTNGSMLRFHCMEGFTMFWSHEKYCVNGTWSSEPWCFETKIGTYCQNARDCDELKLPYSSGMNCTKSTCDCPFGYGYSYSRFQCFDRCPNDDFANTFRKTVGAVLYLYNARFIPGLSENECIERCIDENTFVCRSFDYLLSGLCNLQTKVIADVPTSASYAFSTASYFQRDCL